MKFTKRLLGFCFIVGLISNLFGMQESDENNFLLCYQSDFGNTVYELDTNYECFGVSSIAINKTGKLLAYGNVKGYVGLIDLEKKETILIGKHGEGKTSSTIFSVAFSDDSKKLISSSSDGAIVVWDLDTKKHIHSFIENLSASIAVAFDPQDKFIVCGKSDGSITKFDLCDGDKKKIEETIFREDKFFKDRGFVTSLCFKDDKTLIAGTSCGKVEFWNIETGEILRSLKSTDCECEVLSVVFYPSSDLLLFMYGNGICGLLQTSENISSEMKNIQYPRTGFSSMSSGNDMNLFALSCYEAGISIWKIQGCLFTLPFSEESNKLSDENSGMSKSE